MISKFIIILVQPGDYNISMEPYIKILSTLILTGFPILISLKYIIMYTSSKYTGFYVNTDPMC